jgi:hypothetical protein
MSAMPPFPDGQKLRATGSMKKQCEAHGFSRDPYNLDLPGLFYKMCGEDITIKYFSIFTIKLMTSLWTI